MFFLDADNGSDDDEGFNENLDKDANVEIENTYVQFGSYFRNLSSFLILKWYEICA